METQNTRKSEADFNFPLQASVFQTLEGLEQFDSFLHSWEIKPSLS